MKQVFEIAPPPGFGLWLILGGILALMLGLAAVFAWFGYSARNTRFEVSPDGLSIRGAMYGRSIPLRDLDVDRAQIIDFGRDREYRLSARTNGVGLPGYRAGWFLLHNGEKALVFHTGGSEAVYIPTRQGYSLLMAPRSPRELLEALKQAAG
jgi:hypothetical protein